MPSSTASAATTPRPPTPTVSPGTRPSPTWSPCSTTSPTPTWSPTPWPPPRPTGGGLLELAREFGESTGRGAALRNAIADQQPTPERFLAASEPHERGACFVAAVFDAFLLTYRARIADLLRIAGGLAA